MTIEINSRFPYGRLRPAILAAAVIGSAVALTHPAAHLAAAASDVDVTTYHNDNARTGQNLNETLLTPANVTSATFGKVGFFATDGKVDAQPLLLSGVSIPSQGTHDVLYVATEHDTVYAFDAVTGSVLWSRSLLGTGETTSEPVNGCGQVSPEIGITSTPVIDRSAGPNGVIYVVAMSKSGATTYIQRLHALDVTTGGELFAGPRVIGAAGFDPMQYEERSALLHLNGQVILSWTSHCDNGAYNGWVMSYDASTLTQVSALNTTPNGQAGAYWMAGNGPAADAAGNIYLLAGNGTFDTTLDAANFPIDSDYGNAFLKLTASPGLAVADYFTMWNTVSESGADIDLGSGGTLVLPDLLESGVTRRLAVGAGKDGHIYVANRDSMGKFNASTSDNRNIYQDVAGALGGVWSSPAYFNGTLYYGSVSNPLRAFAIVNAHIVPAPASVTSNSFQYPGTTPSVSASGTANGIVWAVENSSPAVLHAYDAQNLGHELYNSNQAAGARDGFGPGNKFITPTIANGHVYVGTQTGVAVFGLLSGAPLPPTTLTGTATGITTSAATLAGTANPNSNTTLAAFQYGTTAAYGSATTVQLLGSGSSPVSIGAGSISGLACSTTYHFRAIAANAGGVTTGADQPFTTVACPAPTVTTGAATAVGRTTATLNATANPLGVVTTAHFDYGLTTSYGSSTPAQALGAGSVDVSISGGAIGGLRCNTLYHFRAVATSVNGTTNGADATLVTVGCSPSADYDGDGKADLAVFRPSVGAWIVKASGGNYSTVSGAIWGAAGDVPVSGDYDGDGKTDFAVYRPSTSTWYISQSSSGNATFFSRTWGASGDIPVPGDYDGDGKTDIAVYRPSIGAWLVLKSSSAFTTSFIKAWGSSTDIPVPADFDGDGRADLAFFRPSTGTWFVLQSSSGYSTSMTKAWGSTGDVPMPADYDGDGKADFAVYRPATATWYILQSGSGYSTFSLNPLGVSGDVPRTGDFDGDGKNDLAVYHPSTGVWTVLKSSTATTFTVPLGVSTDIPLPAR
jgi:hypothetical protein